MARASLCAIALAGLLSACGTTVHGAGGTAVAGGPEAGLGLPGQATDAPSTTGGTSTGGAAVSGTGGGNGASGQQPSFSGTTGGGIEAPALRTPIKLGWTLVDVATGAAALAAKNFDANAQTRASEDLAKALIRYANQTGGVGGRKIVGYEFKTDFQAELANHDQTAAATCTSATEDVKVDAVIATDSYYTPSDLACFGRHHTPLVAIMHSVSEQTLRTYRPYLATNFALPERTEAALVDGLNRAGFFKGATVGFIADDEPVIRSVYDRIMKPRLTALGVKIASEHYFSVDDPAAQASAAQSTVLAFRAQHVDKVIVSTNVLGLLAFANAENSANYFMKLGIGDYQIAASAAPANAYSFDTLRKAMVGALGVSVGRGLIKDHPEAFQGASIPKDVRQIGPGLKRCLDVASKELGIDYYHQDSSHRARNYASFCDNFFLWLDNARRVGAGLTRANWGLALPGLGTRFQSATVHASRFGADKFAGADDYHVGVYYDANTQCACYKSALPGYFPLPG